MVVMSVSFTAVWSAQVNDLIGGWIVTTYPHPLSEHDHRRDGDLSKRGVIACECVDRAYAILIAKLLNAYPELAHREMVEIWWS